MKKRSRAKYVNDPRFRFAVNRNLPIKKLKISVCSDYADNSEFVLSLPLTIDMSSMNKPLGARSLNGQRGMPAFVSPGAFRIGRPLVTSLPKRRTMDENIVVQAIANGTPVTDAPSDSKAKPRPNLRKNRDDQTWGPTGLYGSRVAESRLLNLLRTAVRPQRLLRIEEVLAARCKRVQCLFENLSDPANGAACLRTMEAFGLTDAHAVEAYEPFRVSEGITKSAHKWINVNKHRHCLDAAADLKAQGFTLIATCLDEDSVPLESLDFAPMQRICLMFGNEERGLSRALRSEAHHKVKIEMSGFSESFNISVSCALLMMHFRHLGIIKPDLTNEEITSLYTKWLLMSAKKAVTLLKRHNLLDEVPDYL